MIIRVQSDDGQDFIVKAGEGTACISVGVVAVGKPQSDIEPFTIEEVEAIIGVLQVAVATARREEEMEARNGH